MNHPLTLPHVATGLCFNRTLDMNALGELVTTIMFNKTWPSRFLNAAEHLVNRIKSVGHLCFQFQNVS